MVLNAVMAFSMHKPTLTIALSLLKDLISASCHENTAPEILGALLKCAENANPLDLVEKVWKWACQSENFVWAEKWNKVLK